MSSNSPETLGDDVDMTLRIDVISDVMCPWCYIGKRRLEKAMPALRELAPNVEVAWHPFQLDATLPPEGKDRQRYLLDKFGSPERVREIYGRIAAAGAQENIPFAFEKISKSPNTLNAHRVIYWAGIEGVQDEIVERLFHGYFVAGADLSDKNVLVAIAESGGMEASTVTKLLDSDSDLDVVKQTINHANVIGVTGVPTFIVGQSLVVSGAQDPGIIVQAAQQARLGS